MSNWTHVAGVIRIDDFRFKDGDTLTADDFDRLIGKECLFHSSGDIWADMAKNPDAYLPSGSEGSLQKSVWVNPDVSHMAAYTVSIFGDLRDHDSADEIIAWFKAKCDSISKYRVVRNAVITVDNEVFGAKTYTYE